MASRATRTSAQRAADYRARKRSQGYRLMQRWVPDLNDPAVRAEIQRQCRAIANSPTEAEDQAFVDAMADWGEY